jgi:hypothetical protein
VSVSREHAPFRGLLWRADEGRKQDDPSREEMSFRGRYAPLALGFFDNYFFGESSSALTSTRRSGTVFADLVSGVVHVVPWR